jgi:hypothetical protein
VESPATQDVADRQDTDIRNIRTGPLTELAAFESNALEPLSAATQNLRDEHDTDAMPG